MMTIHAATVAGQNLVPRASMMARASIVARAPESRESIMKDTNEANLISRSSVLEASITGPSSPTSLYRMYSIDGAKGGDGVECYEDEMYFEERDDANNPGGTERGNWLKCVPAPSVGVAKASGWNRVVELYRTLRGE